MGRHKVLANSARDDFKRGGLISPAAGNSAVSPYGFGAVAALVGLFSPQAADKFKKVFETLFTTAAGKDHTPPSTVVIDRFVPIEALSAQPLK